MGLTPISFRSLGGVDGMAIAHLNVYIRFVNLTWSVFLCFNVSSPGRQDWACSALALSQGEER